MSRSTWLRYGQLVRQYGVIGLLLAILATAALIGATPSASKLLSKEATNQTVEQATPATTAPDAASEQKEQVLPPAEAMPRADTTWDATPELEEQADCGGGSPGVVNSSRYTVRLNGYLDGCTNLTTDLPPGMRPVSNFDAEYVFTAKCNAIIIEIWRTQPDGTGAYMYARRTLTWYNSNGAGWHQLIYPEAYEITDVVPGPC